MKKLFWSLILMIVTIIIGLQVVGIISLGVLIIPALMLAPIIAAVLVKNYNQNSGHEYQWKTDLLTGSSHMISTSHRSN